MTGYLYAAVWVIIAVYLFYMAKRESRFFILPGVFFLFLGGWAAADELTELDLFAGLYGWIYRAVAIAVLVLCAVKYYTYRKNH